MRVKICAVVFSTLFCVCLNHKILDTRRELTKTEITKTQKLISIEHEPSLSNPTIKVKVNEKDEGKKLYKESTSFKFQPTLAGWSIILVPSATAAIWGYTKISNGNVVFGRDIIGLSVIPALITLGVSQIKLNKHKYQEEIFKFSKPLSDECVKTKINNIAYEYDLRTNSEGLITLNLYNYYNNLPLHSDALFSFGLPHESVEVESVTISDNLIRDLHYMETIQEIDTIAQAITNLNVGITLCEFLIIGQIIQGYESKKSRENALFGISKFKIAKSILNGMEPPKKLTQTFTVLMKNLPTISDYMQVYEEYLTYGKAVSFSQTEMKSIWKKTYGDSSKKNMEPIVVRETEKPFKYELKEIGISKGLVGNVWSAITFGLWQYTVLEIPAQRDTLKTQILNELRNK